MLIRAVGEAVRTLGLEGSSLLVAVSGGIDSTALLHALDALPERRGLKLAVGHVNHGLRGEASEADQAFVAELARQRGCPFLCERVEPKRLREGGSSRARPTLQEAARRLRYDALARMASRAGVERIATAHTADDQAETVLLRLLRGTGPDGLAGIPEESGRVVRPLLRVPRAAIEAYARSQGLAWREDLSNQSPAYARNRARRVLRELADEFNPRLLRALADLAEAQGRDRAWIEELVEAEAKGRFETNEAGLAIDGRGWDVLPEPLARRQARAALRRVGGARDVSRVHLERMLRFLREGRPGTRIELPGGLVLAREGVGFHLRAIVGSGR